MLCKIWQGEQLKILHLSLFNEAGSGHLKQLSAESQVALNMKSDTEWVTTALLKHPATPPESYSQVIPRWARFPQLPKLYCWIYLTKEAKKYDFVLLRNISSDPFALFFAPRVRNLVTIHHTKEIEEYDLQNEGRHIRSSINRFLEKYVQPLAMRNLYGVIGVTDEITQYELLRFKKVKYFEKYPNGIVFDSVSSGKIEANSNKNNSSSQTRYIFVASYFHEWHGLDLLLNEVERHYSVNPQDSKIVVDLVGTIPSDLIARIRNSSLLSEVFIVQGNCSQDKLNRLLLSADIAIGSLALDRTGLKEGSTLKVREYLAAGLPVYSGHVDAALPSSFPYYLAETDGISISSMKSFAFTVSRVSKDEVSRTSAPFIDKSEIMGSLIRSLEN